MDEKDLRIQTLKAENKKLTEELEKFKEGNLDPIEMCKVAIALDRLKEYQRLEEQGLLLHLPCAIGSTIYQIAKVRSIHWEEDKIIIDDEGEWKVYDRVFKPVIIPDVLTELGKKIFLTEQEAQVALEKMKGE